MSEQDIQDVWYDYALTFVEKRTNLRKDGLCYPGRNKRLLRCGCLRQMSITAVLYNSIATGEEAYRLVCRALETIGANQVLSNVKQQYACLSI